MKSEKNNPRRGFIKKSLITAAGLTIVPGFLFGKDGNIASITKKATQVLSGRDGLKTVAFICNTYWNLSHADVIGTKLFVGLPTDEGMIPPEVKIVSMWIDQIGANDTGVRIARMNGAVVYPTISEALTLGGDKLAVDGVIYIGEHGEYSKNRFGEPMYPRMNYLEQIFRVFDASNKSVPVYSDKHLSYSWLDSKWIYDRAKELNVPMMAGSSIPYCWRDPAFEHPIGTKITEAVAIGFSGLTSYGFHACEMLQCMVERRFGGETGVASVQGLMGDAVWEAMDSGKISEKLVIAACDNIKGKATGSLRELVREPKGVIIQYNDGLKGAVLLLEEYVNSHWAYAAIADGKTVGTEFVIDEPSMLHSHFSYLALNIEKLIATGKPPAPIERTLLTSGIMDMGVRSIVEGSRVKETPFLNIHYTAKGFHPIRPTHLRPTGQSLGPWPPKGYEFTIPDSFKKKS